MNETRTTSLNMDDDDSGGDYPLFSRSSRLSSSNVSSSGSSG